MAVEQAKTGGFVAPGFEPVAAELARSFSERGELGAAFAAVHDGEPVVDLWGGLADRPAGRPWQEDTLQVIFSGTKGLVAICLLLLIDRGRLELEAPVARYWPEFAAAGKEAVTVRALVSHTARLPGLTTPVEREELTDDVRMAELLAAQPQLEDPRAAHAYHALTYGWLCGELVRRIDGRSVGRFFAEELAGPLDLEIFIGLPEELEPRVSRLEVAENWGATPATRPETIEGDALMRAVWGNPPILGAAGFPWNDRSYHAAEIPGAGGIGTARSIAKLYGSLERLISAEVLERGRTVLERRREPLLDEPQAFGIGFECQTEALLLGPPPDAFGHGGAGGSMHGAWPTERVGFSYAMNLMRDDQPEGDERPRALLGALHACVTARRAR
jgi:CubicO group peptidase (beta-lactamase class C family)